MMQAAGTASFPKSHGTGGLKSSPLSLHLDKNVQKAAQIKNLPTTQQLKHCGGHCYIGSSTTGSTKPRNVCIFINEILLIIICPECRFRRLNDDLALFSIQLCPSLDIDRKR